MHEIARFIDHTLLKPEATANAIEKLCTEARVHRFHAVCVNGSWVQLARHLLEDIDFKVVTVVGFPLGAMDGDAKRYETEVAIDTGAQEIEVVMNIGRLKEGDTKYLMRELRDVVDASDERPVKVIIETSLLTREEKLLACQLITDSGAKFVRTCTDFISQGATMDDVNLVREIVGPRFGVKASGGIRDLRTARAMIEAGANRLGTSDGVAIVNGAHPNSVNCN